MLSLWPVRLWLRNERFAIHWAVSSSSTNELKGDLWPVVTSMWEAPFPRCYFWIRTIIQWNSGVETLYIQSSAWSIKVVSEWWNTHGGVIRNIPRWGFFSTVLLFFLLKTTIRVNSLLCTSYYSSIKSPLWEKAVRPLEVFDGLLGVSHRCLRDKNRGIKWFNMSLIMYWCLRRLWGLVWPVMWLWLAFISNNPNIIKKELIF